MTKSDIQCLKDNVDKSVEIMTIDDECLIAKVLIVTHNDEYDEHDVLYEVVSSNKMDFYLNHKDAGGFVLDFDRIISVKPVPHSEVAPST
jgi:single-stranded DNA-specific DHH superfamily exonuclease